MARRDKPSSTDVTDWHRLFGIVLTKLFEGSDWERLASRAALAPGQNDSRKSPGANAARLARDISFGPLADHNLLTYKSLHEPLDGWALKELAGHSVNYRKQRSSSLDDLLPEESFRLFAIATRFPEKLAGQISLQPVGSGVYDIAWGTDTIRLLVLKQIPAADRNAILNLFSMDPNRIAAGVTRFRSDYHELSSVLTDLMKKYHGDLIMPQTLEEMIRVSEKRVLADIPTPRLVEELPFEKLQEAKTLIERRLAESGKKKKSVASRSIKSRRNNVTGGD